MPKIHTHTHERKTETETGSDMGKGRGGGGELCFLPHQERSRVEGQALPFCTRDHRCRQEVAPVGSQKLRAQPLPDDVVPGREEGTRDGRMETATGTGTGVGTRTGMRSGAGE